MDADSQARQDAVISLLESFDGVEDPSVAVVRAHAARAADQVLAEAIMRAAIPRRLDDRVVAVLAEVPENDGVRILAALTALPFTHPHPGGGWRYHDRIRDALLRDWRSTERLAEYQRLSGLLAHDYEARFRDASGLIREVEVAASVLLAANPQRYSNIRFAVENRLLIAFREAAYHARNSGGTALTDLLGRCSEQMEASDRLVDVAVEQVHRALESLADPAVATLGQSTGGPPGADVPAGTTPMGLALLRYWELRLTLAQDPDAVPDATARLEELYTNLEALAEDLGAVRLKVWTLAELANYLTGQEQFAEAAAVCVRALALSADTQIDPWNEPIIYWQLATLHRGLGDTVSAVAALREAARLSTKVGNHRLAIHSLREEADLLLHHGDDAGARKAAAEALHLAWCQPGLLMAQGRQPAELLDVYKWVTISFIDLVTAADVRLTDTVVRHASALVPPTAATFSRVALRLNHALALAEHGALNRAGQILQETSGLLNTVSERSQRVQTMQAHHLYLGYLEHLAGNHERAIEYWTDFIERYKPVDDRPMATVARAWSYWAEDLAAIRRWDEALETAEVARAAWETIGDGARATKIQALTARTMLEQGRLAEGIEALEPVREPLPDDRSEAADYYHQATGLIAALQGRWVDAAQIHRERAESARRRGDAVIAARAQTLATMCYSRTNAWTEAASSARDAVALFDQLAKAQAFQLSELQRGADEKLAVAVQLCFDGSGERSHDIADARSYVGDALADDPANTWLLMVMFYIRREQGEWRDARHPLTELRARGPSWLAVEWIDAREAEVLANLDGQGAAEVATGSLSSAEIANRRQRVASWLGRTGKRN